MKIDYHILLFEDNFTNLSNLEGYLEGVLEEHGFRLELTLVGDDFQNEIERLSRALENYNPYDLIICDYDLGNDQETGISIAQKLRHEVYTDIIFYSGINPHGLWDLICEQKVQGVYVVNKNQLPEQLEPILNDHLKKITDLNNMRGFVMDAFSVVDKKVRDIVISESADEESSSRKLKDKIDKKYRQLIKRHYSEDSKSTLSDRLAPVNCEFDLARRLLKNLLEGRQDLADLNWLLENDVPNVQKRRNDLAHALPERLPCGSLRLGEKTYNHSEFIELRKEVVKILDELDRFSIV